MLSIQEKQDANFDVPRMLLIFDAWYVGAVGLFHNEIVVAVVDELRQKFKDNMHLNDYASLASISC